MRTKMISVAVVLVGVVAFVGCSDDSTSVGVTPTNTVSLNLLVDYDTDQMVTDEMTRLTPWNAGTPDSLTITAGKFLVRSIRFVDVSTYTIDTDITAADESRDASDASIPFQGPYVMRVNGDQAVDLGSQTVAVGDYNALTLVLHEGKSTDDLGNDTDMVGRSVTVSGQVWYGDQPSSFSFNLDLKTEILVQGDFSVPATGAPNFVLQFDVGNWFRHGDTWLDPNKAENLSLIYRNIQRQITGGPDINGNGQPGA